MFKIDFFYTLILIYTYTSSYAIIFGARMILLNKFTTLRHYFDNPRYALFVIRNMYIGTARCYEQQIVTNISVANFSFSRGNVWGYIRRGLILLSKNLKIRYSNSIHILDPGNFINEVTCESWPGQKERYEKFYAEYIT